MDQRPRAAVGDGAGGGRLRDPGEPARLAAGDLELNLLTRKASRAGQQIELQAREYALLEYLLRNKRTVLTRDQILQQVWGYDYVGDTNVVDVYVNYLRSKIDKDFDRKLIRTVVGVGYMMEA